MLLYASRYKDVQTVINISGRFNLERGIEGRLGRDFKEKIKQDGFIDVINRKGMLNSLLFRLCFIIDIFLSHFGLDVL